MPLLMRTVGQMDGITVSQPTGGHIELVFSSVAADDAGNYTCTSRNTVGVDEKIALLTVQCTSALNFLVPVHLMLINVSLCTHVCMCTHTHNRSTALFSGRSRVSRCQKRTSGLYAARRD